MATRKYREIGSSKQVAGIIASDVIESGKSDGWQGSFEELSQVEKIHIHPETEQQDSCEQPFHCRML